MKKYRIIKGTFHVSGYSPDGDSIRFKAEDPSNWNSFSWKPKKKRKRTKKQLRIEAIDALETHYEGAHQPRAFAVAALERMLRLLGINGVQYSLSITKIVRANDGTPGFIASSDLDTYERPICFAFPEGATLQDGSLLNPYELPLKESINYELANEGLVYPTFYEGLDKPIVNEFRSVITGARQSSRGVWAIDRTNGFTLWSTKTIEEDVIILPKLFRRFISFFTRRSSFDEFLPYLKSNKDPVKLISNGTKTSIDKLITQDGNFFGLNEKPEDLFFMPKD